MGIGALLGPERTHAVCLLVAGPYCRAHLLVAFGSLVRVSVLVGVSRVLFENCTVDASIFVAKFVRAHGGCLGTRSR